MAQRIVMLDFLFLLTVLVIWICIANIFSHIWGSPHFPMLIYLKLQIIVGSMTYNNSIVTLQLNGKWKPNELTCKQGGNTKRMGNPKMAIV